MKDNKDPDEEKRKQIMRIHKLATRLPWIIVGVSLFAFLMILLQVYLTRT